VSVPATAKSQRPAHDDAHASQSPPPARRPVLGLVAGIVILAVLFTVRALAPASPAGSGMADAARDFVSLSISVVIESLPFVFLGIVLSIGVQIWLPEGFLLRRLPRNPALRRPVLSLLGMLLPVCECGNVPLARGLMVKGLTVGESMTFLFAAPILNPITIVTTHQAFGWDNGILVSRILGGFVIANLIGWIYSRHPQPETLLTPRFQEQCSLEDHAGEAAGKWRRSVQLFSRETNAMMPALFVGAGIAGVIQVAVPRDVLVTVGTSPVWSVAALMLLAFIVAVCSNVDAFFILSFGATFMPGSIVAFLVFGPMIDVKMLALLRTTFTAKVLLQISLVVALCSAVLGLAVNYVL
jgi:uncharacterized membrane protein YraQ (UPF0718 family)